MSSSLTTCIATPTEGVLKPPYLGKIVWQIEYGKAVCLQCQVAIGGGKNSIRRHFLTQHQVQTLSHLTGIAKQLSVWKNQFKDVPVKKVTKDLILDHPIEGLRVERAFKCGQCAKTALSAKTIRNHCAIVHHDAKLMKQVDASIFSLKKNPIPIIPPSSPPSQQLQLPLLENHHHLREAIEGVSSRTQALSCSSSTTRSTTVNEFSTPLEVSPLYSKLLRWFPLPESSTD